MNSTGTRQDSSSSLKRKHSEENEPHQDKRELAFQEIKHIEDIYNTMIDVKNSLSTAYQEAGLTFKNTFESVRLYVPEPKKKLSLSTMPTAEELNPSSSRQAQSSQRSESSSQKPSSPGKPSLSLNPTSSLDARVDAKWTLKHQGPGLGLVELMPKAGIFVCEKELAQCNILNTDMRRYGRLLLRVVFSKEALLKCSFAGKQKRPGLDEYARNIFVDYVTKHAKESGWPIVSRHELVSSLSNKMKFLYRDNYKFSSVRVDF